MFSFKSPYSCFEKINHGFLKHHNKEKLDKISLADLHMNKKFHKSPYLKKNITKEKADKILQVLRCTC